MRIDIVVSIDGWPEQFFRSPIRPANFEAVDVGLASQPEMNCIGVLRSIGIPGHNLPHRRVTIVLQRHTHADRRFPATFFPETKADPIAGIF